MSTRIEVSQPWWLLALAVVPYAYWIWRRYTLLPGVSRQQRFVPALRALSLILLVLASAQSTVWAPRPGVDVYVLIDASASIPPSERSRAQQAVESLAGLLGPYDRMAVYAFGRDTVLTGTYGRNSASPASMAAPDPTATDVSRAIMLALDRAGAGGNARILLLSDGVETTGDAGALGRVAALRRIPIDVLPLARQHAAEVMVEDLLAPATVVSGDPYSVRAVLVSSVPTVSALRLYRDGTLIASRTVELASGHNVVAFEGLKEEATNGEGVAYELWIDPLDDEFLENNVGYALVRAQADNQVLIVARERTAGDRVAALLKEHGIATDVRTSGALPPGPLLAGYRAVLLVDVPASQLSRAQLEALAHYVEELGGGLLAIGGPNSFGLGGYARTPLEELLPVSMDTPQSVIVPSLAMVLILDRSGSMAETQGSYSKLDLAKEAALGVLDLMDERDLIGVLAFDSFPYWVVPLQPVENRISIASQIASLSAEGGTNLGPALEAVHRSLMEVEAALKHVVVLTDGRSTPADFEALTLNLRAGGVTVSTVGIGRDADRELLADIARWGDGRYYYTEDIRAIPQIFATETTVIARPTWVDDPFVPEWYQQADFWQDRTPLPPLGGHVITSAKASAAVHLRGPDESPVLATWRRGLGRTAAFTASSEEPWIGAWRDWDGYGALMSQLVRWLMRPEPSEGLVPQLVIEGSRALLTVDALDAEGGFQNFLELVAEVLAPDGSRFELQLNQVAPGRYEASFPASAQGVYTAYVWGQADDALAPAIAGAVVAYPEEYRVLRPDSGLLFRLAHETQGLVLTDTTPESLRALLTHPRPATSATSLAPYFFAAALVLIFLDIALRYVPIARLIPLLHRGRRAQGDGVVDEEALRRRVAEDVEAWEKVVGRDDEPAFSRDPNTLQAGKYLASRKKRELSGKGGDNGE